MESKSTNNQGPTRETPGGFETKRVITNEITGLVPDFLKGLRHKSTTRPNRNTEKIAAMALELKRAGHSRPEVLNIGPGMALKYIGRLCEIRKPFHLFRRLEVGLRAALPMPSWAYEIYETPELLSIFNSIHGKDPVLRVMDFDATILATANRQFGRKVREFILADLSQFANPDLGHLQCRFDAVFVTAVIKRIACPKGRLYAAQNILAMCKPGALITNTAPEFVTLGCIQDPRLPGLCTAP